MNTTQTPITTSGSTSMPRSAARWLYILTGAVVFAATIALFYAEEDWRGRRAWENCKRELEAKGAKLDWDYYTPPPVPDNENFFGVPEMQKWFVGRGHAEEWFVGRGHAEGLPDLHYPGWTNYGRVSAANLTIGLTGATPPSGSTVLRWSDTTNAQATAARLMKNTLGPMASDPVGFNIMLKRPEEVRPVQLFLQCQTAPSIKELENFLPKQIAAKDGDYLSADSGTLKVELIGSNTYRVSMPAPLSASDYVAWGETIEPKLAIIHQAVQRPDAQMLGDYSNPTNVPIPNFVTMRTISQRLSGLAECDMLLGRPENALKELTFLHQVRRILEFRPSGKPMSLVAAMINVAVAGLDVNTIQDGLRMRVWREPELAALQEQLREINLRPYVVDAFAVEQAATCAYGEMIPPAELGKLFKSPENEIDMSKRAFFKWLYNGLISRVSFFALIPRGWIYQNMVVNANLHQMINDSMASPGQLVEPSKVSMVAPIMDRELAHPSPFKVLARIAIPNFTKAVQTMSHNQTEVNQARMACALERFRLAHGEYPADLDALLPQFIDKIPSDIIGGRPPHYRRTDDGKFLLYSIGWSEKDHGGQLGKDGDWVWGDTF